MGLLLFLILVCKLEFEGVSVVVYGGLYLFVVIMGVGGDLWEIVKVLLLFVVGVVWIFIYVLILVVMMWLCKVFMFLFVIGSMGNVGGVILILVVVGIY